MSRSAPLYNSLDERATHDPRRGRRLLGRGRSEPGTAGRSSERGSRSFPSSPASRRESSLTLPGLSGWAQRVVPDLRYYGWRMALVGALCASLSGPGQSFVLSLYVEPLMAATGLDRRGLSLLYSLATLAAALLLPVVGARADRWQGGKFLARPPPGAARAPRGGGARRPASRVSAPDSWDAAFRDILE